MIFKFRKGFSVPNAEPQAIGEELERVRVSHAGQLRAENIIEAAADEGSPLHTVFTWDDEKAAHAHRLWQGRQLMRSVVIVDDKGKEQPAYWNVRIQATDDAPAEQYYQSAVVIASNPSEYASALRLMQSKLVGAESGLSQLLQLAPRNERKKVRQASAHVADASRALSA